MSKSSPRHRKPSARVALTAALAVGLLALSATSALAVEYDNGNGSFTAAAHVNVPPSPPCATYSLYNADLTFPGGTTATVSSDPVPTSTNFQWGENGEGTYKPQTSVTGATTCNTSGGPGAQENGFTGTLTTTSGVCRLSGGTYQRGGQPTGATDAELNVEYNFATQGTGTCPAAPVTLEATVPSVPVPAALNPPITIGPFQFYYFSECNSPIAPTSCVLGPAVQNAPNGPF